jgi:hypothetical protein
MFRIRSSTVSYVPRYQPTINVRICDSPEVMVRDDDTRLAVIVPITRADPAWLRLFDDNVRYPAQQGWRILTTESALQVAGLGSEDVIKALDWVKKRIADTNPLREQVAHAVDEAAAKVAEWWNAQEHD